MVTGEDLEYLGPYDHEKAEFVGVRFSAFYLHLHEDRGEPFKGSLLDDLAADVISQQGLSQDIRFYFADTNGLSLVNAYAFFFYEVDGSS